MSKSDPPRVDGITDDSDAREPYEAPRLETEELFEVLALSCGKINPVNFNCQRIQRAS